LKRQTQSIPPNDKPIKPGLQNNKKKPSTCLKISDLKDGWIMWLHQRPRFFADAISHILKERARIKNHTSVT
jgi:hypothetical protein